MAVSVAFPPMPTMPAEPSLGGFCPTLGAFSLAGGMVKTEPLSLEENMETASDATYTELSSAFSQIKQGRTDVYQRGQGGRQLASWTFRHPEHWEAREVLDWLFSLADTDAVDGALFRGEAYNTLTGKQLCAMSLADYVSLDQHYGARVHHMFHWMLETADFKMPCPPETFKTEAVEGNVPHFAFLEAPTDVTQQPRRARVASPAAEGKLSVFLDGNRNEMKVSLDGLGLYDIDMGKQLFDHIDDSDYNSAGSDADLDPTNSVTEVLERILSDEEDTTDLGLADLGRKTHTPSSSSDSGCESDDRRTNPRRRQSSTSKGNHLWEFVLELLKDPRFNPSLLKWEDRDLGVFKFVQSEAVAQMWGRKKNNPGMTYEKLSRAMRFCRTTGYFDSVPKTGRFPKKLCFKFGHKADGWRE